MSNSKTAIAEIKKLMKQFGFMSDDATLKSFKLGNEEEARDFWDLGIAYIADKRLDGYEPEDLIEGIKVDLWLERFWMFLENKNLLM